MVGTGVGTGVSPYGSSTVYRRFVFGTDSTGIPGIDDPGDGIDLPA